MIDLDELLGESDPFPVAHGPERASGIAEHVYQLVLARTSAGMDEREATTAQLSSAAGTSKGRGRRRWPRRAVVVGFVVAVGAVAVVVPLSVRAGHPALPGPAGETGAGSFAQRVLGEASIPPGAHSTSTASALLEGPLETPGVSGLIDLHRLYLVDKLPGAVESYVEAHLPYGGKVTSTAGPGGPTPMIGVVVSLPISGPNEYLAQLAYEVVPVGSHGAELRVDAQSVWLPNRSIAELVPAGGIVEVTGFTRVGPSTGPSGSVTVRLSSTQAMALREVLDALPLGPAVGCHENALLYEIAVRTAVGSVPTFEAEGYACRATVAVTENGRRMPPLYDAGCSLLHAVVGFLPKQGADGTRSASAGCRK